MPGASLLTVAALPGPAFMHACIQAARCFHWHRSMSPACFALAMCHQLGGADSVLRIISALASGCEPTPCLCRYAALSAQQNSEEAIDIVLIESYSGAGTMWKGKKQYKYTPFNPNDKCTVSYVLEEQSGKKYKLLKGAPQVDPQLPGAHPVASSCSCGLAQATSA